MILGYLGWAAHELTHQHEPDEVLKWIGERFDLFLSGQAKSLDEAFQLNPRRGAPPTTAKRDLQVAVAMIEFRGFPSPIKHPRGAILAEQITIAEKFNVGPSKPGEKNERDAKAVDRLENRYRKLAEFEIFKRRTRHVIDFRKAIFDGKSKS